MKKKIMVDIIVRVTDPDYPNLAAEGVQRITFNDLPREEDLWAQYRIALEQAIKMNEHKVITLKEAERTIDESKGINRDTK